MFQDRIRSWPHSRSTTSCTRAREASFSSPRFVSAVYRNMGRVSLATCTALYRNGFDWTTSECKAKKMKQREKKREALAGVG